MRWLKMLPLVLLVCACAAGDDGGGSSGGGGGPGTTMDGTATKGRFTAGNVAAFAINSDGTPGAQQGTGAIDATGSFSFEVGGSGPYALTVSGGSFLDEATTSVTQTADLAAVVPVAGTYNVTPLTTMAARLAQRRMAGATPAGTAIATSNLMVGNWFGVSDILGTQPADLTAGPIATVDAAAEYGAILAGISQLALSLTVASDQLAAALAQDAADGVLDGMDNAAPIALGAGNLSATAAQGDLAGAIGTFLASGANNSGLDATDFAQLIARLNNRPDELLFPLTISVTPAPLTVAIDMLVQFSATALFSDNTQGDITATATWDSTVGAVASISATGLADALSAGGTSIQASLLGTIGSSTLNVGNYTISSIAVTPAAPTLFVGGSQQFTATATHSDASTADITALVDWGTSNGTVLGMSASGLGSALARGSADATATAPGTGVSGQTTVSVQYSYATHIQPIFNNNCVSCHPGNANLNLTSYTNLMAGGQSGAVVVPGNSANSILVQRIEGTIQPQMPQAAPPLSAQTIQRIKDWIDDGALNN